MRQFVAACHAERAAICHTAQFPHCDNHKPQYCEPGPPVHGGDDLPPPERQVRLSVPLMSDARFSLLTRVAFLDAVDGRRVFAGRLAPYRTRAAPAHAPMPGR